MTLQELLNSLKGSAGKAIDTVGRATGNIAPELNISENLEAQGAPAMSQEEQIASVQNDPRFSSALMTSADPYYPSKSQVPNQPTYVAPTSSNDSSAPDLSNPVKKTEYANSKGYDTYDQMIADQGGNGGSDGGFAALVARARGAYDEAVKRARYGLERARGVRDEGLDLLGKRRGEFKETYDTGNNDILTSYEGERGNLQASAQGAQKRAANALRAMGITGGSGALNYQGRMRQEQAKQQGNLATEKTANERANLGAFNERNTWADTQEGAINRAYRDAEEAARATEAQAGLVQQGDVDSINRASENYFNNILANQQALAAAKLGASSYQAPSYAVDMNNFAGAIGNNLPAVGTVGGTNTAVNGGVSLEEMDPTLALLKKRAGVAGAGLYA